jgi:flagella basal body P-ring formation protein FlgA
MRRTMLKLLCLSAFAPVSLASARQSEAATLRSVTLLESPDVRLSDLFDDAGPLAGRVLGAAPAPGTRLIVEAPQLAAIARQFGVDWRPASSTDRVVLDRPGRALPREAVIAALHDALALVGAAPDLEIAVPEFTAPMVPQESEPQASIDQLDYDAGTGRFTALLTVTAEGMTVHRERLSGRVEEMVAVPVLPRRLAVGAVLTANDIQMARVRAALVRGDVARLPEQIVGLAVRHPVAPGQPVLLANLMRPVVVQKGSRVVIELQSPGLALVAQGTALGDGAIGERISVLNPATKATLSAEVLGPERVRVTPGTPPLATGETGGPLVATR